MFEFSSNELCVCKAEMLPEFNIDELAVYSCPRCHTRRAFHKNLAEGSPWSAGVISQDFKDALFERRRKQAEEILNCAPNGFFSNRVLDYGFGQGAFLEKLLVNKVEAYGVDYDVSAQQSLTLADRVWKVDEWESIAESFDTISFLDVIEHHPNPHELLGSDLVAKANRLLVKVPLVEGPLYRVATIFSRMGHSGPLDGLYQVGEPYPHHWYYSATGMVALLREFNFTLVRSMRVVEVGMELPKRLKSMPRFGVVGSTLLSLFGAGLAMTAKMTSDTGIFFFEKKTGSV